LRASFDVVLFFSGAHMRLMFAVLAMSVCLAGICRADTIQATFQSVDYGGTLVTVTLNPVPGGSPYQVTGIAGEYHWQEVAGSSPVLGNNGSFDTFCVELTQDINFNQPPYTYTTTDALSLAPEPGDGFGPMGDLKADLIRELWSADIDNVIDNTSATEFQFAVWDIIYGTSLHVDSSNQSLLNAAQGWVSALDQTGNGPQDNVLALTSGGVNGAQDQITGSPLIPLVSTAPLPSSVSTSAALLAILGMWVGVRRRKASPLA
jgi:hypothetical protein